MTQQVLSLDLEALYYVNFWRADEKVCLAIGNYDHSILRNSKGKGLSDMPGARDELNNFAEKILEFGFKQSNVLKVENADYSTIMDKIEYVRNLV